MLKEKISLQKGEILDAARMRIRLVALGQILLISLCIGSEIRHTTCHEQGLSSNARGDVVFGCLALDGKASFMNCTMLREFFEREIVDAREKDRLV